MVLAAMHTQAQRGAAIVAVFHDLNLAAAVADELVLLKGGRIMMCGTPAEVLKDELLSNAYGCRVLANRTPEGEQPFVLPPAALAPSRRRTA
jgi:iron complex transport system ATP-binding protein